MMTDPVLAILAEANPAPETSTLPPATVRTHFETLIGVSVSLDEQARRGAASPVPRMPRRVAIVAAAFTTAVLVLGGTLLLAGTQDSSGPAAAGPLEVTMRLEVVHGGQGTFAASGPAVDAGLMCTSGTTIDIVHNGQLETSDLDGVATWMTRLACADGTGDFTIAVDDRRSWVGGNRHHDGTWTVLSGDGSLARLGGGGEERGTCHDAIWCEDVYEGTLVIGEAD